MAFLADNPNTHATEISRRTSINANTLHILLNFMVREGYLNKIKVRKGGMRTFYETTEKPLGEYVKTGERLAEGAMDKFHLKTEAVTEAEYFALPSFMRAIVKIKGLA